MRCSTFLSRLLLMALVIVIPLSSARGQRLEDGEVAFVAKARPTRALRVDLFKGIVQADTRNKDHLEAAEIAAKEVTYYLHWLTQAGRPPSGKVNEQVNEFEGRLNQMSKFRANTLVYQQLYCRHAIDSALEVIQKGRPIAAVNAARILSLIPRRGQERGVLMTEKDWGDEVLPRLAEGNAELLANACLTGLANPKAPDGARYWLLQALANLQGVPRQTPPLVKPQTEEKVERVAIDQIEKKMVFPRATPPQEVEGYKVLRLQAVKVLAQVRTPVKGKDRPALVLARVAGSDESIVPAPRLEERIEAVIGLTRIGASAAKFPDYQLDYAVAQICMGVHAFNVQANANLDSKPAARLHPWKVEAARLNEAVESLKASVKDPYVQNAVSQCQTVLSALERGSNANATIKDWVTTNPPTNKTLFKGDDSTAIKGPDEDE